jgi:general secretion pathway protein D
MRPAFFGFFSPVQGRLSLRASGWLSRLLSCLLIGVVIAGCAAGTAYREGRELAAQGRTQAALAKFQEAIELEPRDAEYRAAYIQTREQGVLGFVQQADRLMEEGKFDEAEKHYQRALDIDPSSDRARAGMRSVMTAHRHERLLKDAKAAWEAKNEDAAQSGLRTILSENNRHAGALALRRDIQEKSRKPAPESVLAAAYRKPITIEFKDVSVKQVFEVISRTSGLNFLFDKDVKTDQKTSIFLKNSTIESAVHFTLLTNQLEQQVLDANTILIYPNTSAKQKDYQEMMVKTFFLTNAEAKSVAATLKTIVKSRDVVVDDKLNMLIVRDSPDAIRLAEKLVALHDMPEPEVMLEVEILEVKRTRLLELGVRWPDTLALTPLPSTSGGTLTLRDLQRIDSGSTGVSVGSFTIKARKEDGDTNILANPRIRARNREKAKILIGERVPNITTTSTSTGFVSESINYVDVGLKLEVEPNVYLDNDVAIKISLEVSNIVSQLQTKSGSVAYQIGTRTASTVLRLKDGENQVLAGLINDEDRSSSKKVPAIGELPLVGRLFGSTTDDTQKTEIVLSITPRLVRNIQLPDASLSEFRAGTDTSFRNRPETVGGVVSASSSAKNPVPTGSTPAAGKPSQESGKPGASSSNTQEQQNGGAGTAGAGQAQWQGPSTSKVGEVFSVQLLMQSESPITSLPMAVGYDNRVLQVMGITEGDYLKQGGAQSNFSSRIDPNGQILMTGTRSGEGGASGSGNVATISFRALGPSDAARIQLLTAAPVGVNGRAVPIAAAPPHMLKIQP